MRPSPQPPAHRRATRIAAGLTGSALLLVTGAVATAPAAPAAPPSRSEPQVADLVDAKLRNQQLAWKTCKFPDLPKATADRLLATPGLQCATVTVPRDWYRAKDGNTITVEISRVRAKDPAKRRGIMLINPGGPGGSGLGWSAAMQQRSPDVGAVYDTIGFDPRGVGQSTRLVCTYDANASTQAEAAKKYADGCLNNPLTPFITTRQTNLDMDFIRHLLGEPKMNYIGYSYGTWLGGSYAATFPSKTDRFILDSSVDMSTGTLERTWDLQPGTRDRQFQDMMLPYLARHDDKYKMGTTSMDARRKFEAAGGFDNYFNLLFGANTVIQAMYSTDQYEAAGAILSALSNRTTGTEREDFRLPYGTKAQQRVPVALAEVRENLARMDISADARQIANANLDQALGEYRTASKAVAEGTPNLKQEDGAFEAIRCQDGQWTTDLNVWEQKLTDGFKRAPLTGMLQSIPACAFWPAQEKGFPELKDKDIPGVLFLQSEFDAATAYEGAEASMKKFKKSRSVLIDNEGSHGVFPYGTECVDKPALTWLVDGQLPARRSTGCVGVPLPGEIYTYNVGGTINPAGKMKGFKMESEELKQANELVAQLRREAGIPDVPGDDATTAQASAAALPKR